jgi:hypothetical protein
VNTDDDDDDDEAEANAAVEVLGAELLLMAACSPALGERSIDSANEAISACMSR